MAWKSLGTHLSIQRLCPNEIVKELKKKKARSSGCLIKFHGPLSAGVDDPSGQGSTLCYLKTCVARDRDSLGHGPSDEETDVLFSSVYENLSCPLRKRLLV
ncbi:hypothetical protein Fot_03681 [Forsythia ovata]|uniref:Uncharacterized protein n=1 Tax=Forsythia ovata TaxID=205694 RepID=A0ABD1XAE3_9LAMI